MRRSFIAWNNVRIVICKWQQLDFTKWYTLFVCQKPVPLTTKRCKLWTNRVLCSPSYRVPKIFCLWSLSQVWFSLFCLWDRYSQSVTKVFNLKLHQFFVHSYYFLYQLAFSYQPSLIFKSFLNNKFLFHCLKNIMKEMIKRGDTYWRIFSQDLATDFKGKHTFSSLTRRQQR